MGMTDEQFASYQRRFLRLLELARKEVSESEGRSQILDTIIKDIKDELQKP